jgi:hypothetical protein
MNGSRVLSAPGFEPVVGSRTSLLAVALALVVSAGCSTPKVEGPGGKGAGGSIAPGRTDAGGGNAGGSGGGIQLPDAGAGTGADGPGPGTQTCAEQGHRAERVPLDIMFLVDSSGSMGGMAAMRTKWQMVHEALSTFLRDPMSAGLGAGLATFPSEGPAPACQRDSDCPGGVPGIGCAARRCVSPGGFVATALPCLGGFCLPGTTCVPAGRCTQSGMACAEMGRPCPGGAGDVCDLAVRTCFSTGVDNVCDPAIYARPLVNIGELPATQPALQGTLDAVRPAGNTPMLPAVRGVLDHLGAHLASRPGRRAALVLATDGLPDGCMSSPQTIGQVAAALAGARTGAAVVPSYVIGVFSADTLGESRPALEQLATAGGTGTPFVLEPNADLTARFLEALNQIRGVALACEFQIPRPASGTQDYGKVNVRYTSAAGAAPEDLVYVGSADRCDPARGGWYYDVPPAGGTPTRIIVCASTCARFKQQTMGSVEIGIGCTTRVE